MKERDRYLKIVEWSDEDQVYIGRCPELFIGGCHGDDEAKVYKELCEIVDEWIEDYKKNGEPLPEPKLKTDYSGKFVMRVGPELHKALAYRAQIANESLNNYCVAVLREEAAAYHAGPPPKLSKKKQQAKPKNWLDQDALPYQEAAVAMAIKEAKKREKVGASRGKAKVGSAPSHLPRHKSKKIKPDV